MMMLAWLAKDANILMSDWEKTSSFVVESPCRTPMISPLIFSGMEMLEVRRQIRSILKSNSVMTELLRASRM